MAFSIRLPSPLALAFERATGFHAAILDRIDDAVIVTDPEHRITYLNHAAEQRYGVSLAQVAGRPQSELYFWRWLRKEDEAEAQESLTARGAWRGEIVHVARDGREIATHATVSVLRDHTGAWAGLVEITRDVTGQKAAEAERRRAQEVLGESERRLQAALAGGRMGMWEWDLRTNRSVWNPSQYELLGWPPGNGEVNTADFFRQIHPDDRPRLERSLAEIMGSGKEWRDEFRFIHADGQVRWLAAAAHVLRDAAGRPVRMIGVNYDITDRRLAEEQVRKARAVAEEAGRAKDHFLAVLSHELRTPLTPVLTCITDLLDDPSLPAPLREDLEMMRRNIALEIRLIDDLLDVTRIGRGKLMLHSAPVDLRQVVRHAADTCMADAQATGLELRVETGAEPLPVEGDAARLQQVFWNLIKNAVKFTPRGGIRVHCRREAGKVVAVVEDDGIGMEAEVLGRVFDAFEQGGAGTTRRFGGLGLGLAISKGLVEMHGGTITAASAGRGRGSSFTVVLPLSAGAAGVAAVPPVEVVGRHSARVLLVEDHEDSARMLARLLRRAGHEVQVAGDVGGALRLARGQRFDLLISDISLPDGNGLELMRQLTAEFPQLRGRGIALSGHGMDNDVQMSRASGFVAHLVKPVDPRELQRMIAAVLAGAPAVSRAAGAQPHADMNTSAS